MTTNWTMAIPVLSALSLLLVLLPDIYCEKWTRKKMNKRPPHIVFIVADDLGWNDVGWHNVDMITPNLNWLARRGIILDSVYAQPTCTPSRNSFMTGYFPFHTELQDVIEPSMPLYLPLKYVLLPERLKQAGYATHIVGKWHLGYCNRKYTPTRRGFDSFFGFYVGGEDHYTHEKTDTIQAHVIANVSFGISGSNFLNSFVNVRAARHTTGRDFRFNDTIWRQTEGVYSTHAFAARATEIITRHNPETPLFLYLPFSAPHSPLSVPEKYQRQYRHIKSKERRIYSGMVTALDEAVGNITSALHGANMIDNLLIVFTSDNGGNPYMGGNNMPLRGSKNTIWEGGTRVPSFVYSRTLLRRKAYTNNGMIHAADWFPTFLEIAGAKPVRGIDGRSQWKLLSKGGESSRKEFVYNISPSGEGAIRIGDYKLIVGNPGFHNDWYPAPGATRIPRKRYKGGRFDEVKLNKTPYLLYNLHDDPEERLDISSTHPDILREMILLYKNYNASKVVPRTPGKFPTADPTLFKGFWSPGWC